MAKNDPEHNAISANREGEVNLSQSPLAERGGGQDYSKFEKGEVQLQMNDSKDPLKTGDPESGR